jgi:hypothetical protein
MLVGATTMLALRTNIEEFQVPENEMQAFMDAAQKVARHYSIETTQKTLDWIAFGGIGIQIFGTRAVAISLKLRDNKRKENAGSGRVVNFPGPFSPPGPHGGAEFPQDYTG